MTAPSEDHVERWRFQLVSTCLLLTCLIQSARTRALEDHYEWLLDAFASHHHPHQHRGDQP